MSLGPIMLDIREYRLQVDEVEMLQHPLVGGVILFSRNFDSLEQLDILVQEIHAIRTPRLLVAVDHEGGRVQRFRSGFTHLPACRKFGEIYEHDRKQGLKLAEIAGWVMAAELRALDIDFSFAPVLDLNKGISQVIGDRAFYGQPDVVSALAKCFMSGMNQAGMHAVGKHFPGHGSVLEDSHCAIPRDTRLLADIQMEDLITFQSLCNAGIAAIMPAHIIYSNVDEMPATFSSFWLQSILREQLNFKGAILSDDLAMVGAEAVGSFYQRAMAALNAGCDMVLVCNHQEQAKRLLDELDIMINPISSARLLRMQGHPLGCTLTELKSSLQWKQALTALKPLLPEQGVPIIDPTEYQAE